MKYTGRTSRNINIKALGLLLCILVASYGIIKAPASDTRKLEADLRKKQQLINEEKGKKVDGIIYSSIAVNICITYYGSGK